MKNFVAHPISWRRFTCTSFFASVLITFTLVRSRCVIGITLQIFDDEKIESYFFLKIAEDMVGERETERNTFNLKLNTCFKSTNHEIRLKWLEMSLSHFKMYEPKHAQAKCFPSHPRVLWFEIGFHLSNYMENPRKNPKAKKSELQFDQHISMLRTSTQQIADSMMRTKKKRKRTEQQLSNYNFLIQPKAMFSVLHFFIRDFFPLPVWVRP